MSDNQYIMPEGSIIICVLAVYAGGLFDLLAMGVSAHDSDVCSGYRTRGGGHRGCDAKP